MGRFEDMYQKGTEQYEHVRQGVETMQEAIQRTKTAYEAFNVLNALRGLETEHYEEFGHRPFKPLKDTQMNKAEIQALNDLAEANDVDIISYTGTVYTPEVPGEMHEAELKALEIAQKIIEQQRARGTLTEQKVKSLNDLERHINYFYKHQSEHFTLLTPKAIVKLANDIANSTHGTNVPDPDASFTGMQKMLTEQDKLKKKKRSSFWKKTGALAALLMIGTIISEYARKNADDEFERKLSRAERIQAMNNQGAQTLMASTKPFLEMMKQFTK